MSKRSKCGLLKNTKESTSLKARSEGSFVVNVKFVDIIVFMLLGDLGDLGDLGAATRNEEVLSCSPKICCLGLTI